MSRPYACFLILVSVIVFQSGQSSANNLPTDPNDQYYETFQNVSSHIKTAQDLFTNFFRGYGPASLYRRFGHYLDSFNDRCRFHKDTVIVMDGSGSVDRCQFEKGKKALQHMVALANFSYIDAKFAAVTFASSARVHFKFLPCASAVNEISQIPYPGGSTNTQAGLTEAKKLFDDPSSGWRIAGRKTVLLVTDGHSNVQPELTIPKAKALKDSGVEIFVVAVGTYINGIDEMVKVASYPPERFLLRVKTLQQFWEAIKWLISAQSPFDHGLRTILQGQYDPPC